MTIPFHCVEDRKVHETILCHHTVLKNLCLNVFGGNGHTTDHLGVSGHSES